LGYDNRRKGTTADLRLNIFSERLSEVSLGGTPNIFEQPRPNLKFAFAQNIFGGLTIKFSGSNLLEPGMKKVHHFKGNDYPYQEYETYRSFSLGLTYQIG
jgi:hypothetical protein